MPDVFAVHLFRDKTLVSIHDCDFFNIAMHKFINFYVSGYEIHWRTTCIYESQRSNDGIGFGYTLRSK